MRRSIGIGVVAACAGVLASCGDAVPGSGSRAGSAQQSEAEAPVQAPLTRESEASLAVLPFRTSDGSGDSSRVLADGLYTDLTARLTSSRGFRLKELPRGGDFSDATVPELVEILAVDHVLTGSVDRTGENMHVEVALIDGLTDLVQWEDSFDAVVSVATLTDVQAQIARRVIEALEGQTDPADMDVFERPLTDDIEAWTCFQRGSSVLTRQAITDTVLAQRVLADFECATENDPGFGEAWAMLAIATAIHPWRGWQGEDWFDRARSHLDNALTLAPVALETRLAGGYLAYYRRNYTEAEQHFTRAYERRPNDPRALTALAVARRRIGRWEEAAAIVSEAREISPGVLWRVAVTTNRGLGRLDEARAVLDEALRTEVDPILSTVREERFLTALHAGDLLEVSTVMVELDDQLTAEERSSWNARREYYRKNWADVVRYARDAAPEQGYLLAAEGAMRLGDAATARAYADSAVDVFQARVEETTAGSSVHSQALASLGEAYALLGWRSEALEAARKAVRYRPPGVDFFDGPNLQWRLANTYALLGLWDEALPALELAISLPGGYPPGLLEIDPVWDPVRDDPRMAAIVRSIDRP